MTDPSARPPHVAAVVVTHNRKALLRQCLTALQAQTYALTEIIVVDNASTDGTAQMVETAFPDITLRVLDENRGGAGGFHEGMRLAAERDVDWIWVMDDDAEPKPDALERLFASGLCERKETVALTPLKRFPSGMPQYDQTGAYDPVRGDIKPATSVDEPWTEVTYGAFVGLLCRASAVATVGLPDPSFFLWYDDVEYCLRLARQGRLYLVSSSTIVHHVSEDVRRTGGDTAKPWRYYPLSYFWRYYYAYRNRLLLLYRHVSSPADQLRGTAAILAKAVRSAAMVCAYHDDDVLAKLQLIGRGVVDGLFGRTGKRVDPDQY